MPAEYINRLESVFESIAEPNRRAILSLYRLKPGPLQEVDAWLAPFRPVWSGHIDALERHLDRMDHMDHKSATPTKTKTKRRR